MATGIVSVALHLAGYEWLSRAWYAVAVAIWLLVMAALVVRLVTHPAHWSGVVDAPPALTVVAATAVLGTRWALSGAHVLPIGALGVALLAWAVLMPAVLGNWRTPTVGAHFLVCVATQGVAVFGATLAITVPGGGFAAAAAVPFVVGLGLYVLVLRNFSFAELRTGAGDQWVFAGALAISTLAAAHLALAAEMAGWPPVVHTLLQLTTVVLLVLALAAYVVLVISEITWPRLKYDVRRWSTAFPLGMTAAALITTAHATGANYLSAIGVALTWPAVALCVVLLVASARRFVRLAAAG